MTSAPTNILVSVNDSYVMPLSVLLTSLYETNATHDIAVWALDAGLSDDSRALLERQAQAAGVRLEFVVVDPTLFEGLPTAAYISVETYFRLLAAEVLPPELDRVLWLDADMVVTGDLGELYDMPFGDNGLIGCGYPAEAQDNNAQCAVLGLDPSRYVNAGVLLINLEAWRGIDMRAQVAGLADRLDALKYADQDMLSIIFEGRIGLVDWRLYNFRTNTVFSPDDERLAREQGAVVHYCGTQKPWMFYDVPLGDVWREYYDKSPFAAKQLRLISRVAFSRMVQRFAERTKQ